MDSSMKKGIWFSRHQPTGDQMEGANKMGFEIVAITPGKVLGAMNLSNDDEVKVVVDGLVVQVKEHWAAAIFGVPSTPILEHLACTAFAMVSSECLLVQNVPFYAAWNVSRSVEGGPSTFKHKKWSLVGHLSIP